MTTDTKVEEKVPADLPQPLEDDLSDRVLKLEAEVSNLKLLLGSIGGQLLTGLFPSVAQPTA